MFTDDMKRIGLWVRWSRVACAALTALATATGSAGLLSLLAAAALAGAICNNHPFDLLYNHFLRFFAGTPELPAHSVAKRMGCGYTALHLGATSVAFAVGEADVAILLGGLFALGAFVAVAANYCVPCKIYHRVWG